MALIKCEECGRDVSDQAAACPNCGANPRVHTLRKEAYDAEKKRINKRNTGCLVVIACACAFLLAFCWRATKPAETWGKPAAAHAPLATVPNETKLANYAKEMEDTSLSADARDSRAQWIVKNFPNSPEAKRANELLPGLEEDTKLERIGRQWSYWVQSDEMSGKKVAVASVESANRFEFGFPYQGAQAATLKLRKHPRWGNDVIFSIERGQILCSSYSDCTIKVRFDEGPVQTYQGTDPSDHSTETVFIPNYASFVAKLAKAKKLRIEFNVFHEGARTAEFDVEGFNPERATGKEPKVK